ncbi:MAG: type II secretion system protein GspG [Lentisphaeria bacterium]|nr:type II secretion system protein GspG [Lentisphaeria bacterium]
MRRKSFTLLELMVSIGIILVLAAITFGGMNYASKRAQEAKTIAMMEEFINALEAFKQDYGFYPIIDKDKAVRVDFSKDGWKLFMNETKNKKNRAYMEGELAPLIDAYGQQFWYQYPGKKNTAKYDLWSMGPDKQHGTKKGNSDTASEVEHAGDNESDDICSWKQR